MPYPFVTQKQLEDRLSATTVQRIYDDNRDGVADTDPVAQLLADASSKVAGRLRGVYTIAQLVAATCHELVRVTLDVAVAMAAQRHPEVVRRDWEPLMRQADKDVTAIRLDDASLDTDGAPEPKANVGGQAYPDPLTEDVYSFARDGFGDF